LIDLISEINQECAWSFITNGQYRLNTAILSRLDKIRIRSVQVSLDSVRPETYSKIRINGHLDRTLRMIEDLLKYREERGPGRDFPISVSMCVQQANWSEIREFLEFAQSRPVEPVFQFAFKPDETSLLLLNAEKRREIRDYVNQMAVLFGNANLYLVASPLTESIA
jgi:MoaA/NifB/PqqE/SkfB family radical SAM enzyme